MSVSGTAATAVSLQQSQTRAAIATEIVKQNHQADQAVVALVEQAAEAGKQAAAPAGHAGRLDVSV